MEPLTITTWLWGDKYSNHYVDKLQNGIARHLRQPHSFLVIRPDPAHPLLQERGCFIRLRMFDPQWQAQQGLVGRIVCIDLDVVITGNLDALFDRPDSFCILKGANSINPCPFNGSLMMLRAGAHAAVWNDFNLAAAYKIPFHKFPDDQGWIAHKMPKAAGWHVGTTSGIWAFRKRGWPPSDQLPAGARLVCFPGGADPAQFTELGWIARHWQ